MAKTKTPPIVPNPSAKERFDRIINAIWGENHIEHKKWINDICFEFAPYDYRISTFDYA